MLQKLSKCEVQAHNTRIHKPINLTLKSILAKFESQKLPFLQFQTLSTLNFGKFGKFRTAKSSKNDIY